MFRTLETDAVPLDIRNVTFMSADPGHLADFWSAATGYAERRASPEEIVVAPASWGFPRLTFQRVDAPRTGPAPVHLDLTADDMAAEVERLVGLGATRVRTVEATESGTLTWTVMLDPDGNEFCVAQRPAAE